MTESQKNWIDNANYTQLLERWRFASVGDTIFQGESGDYYKVVMSQKKEQCDHVQSSKIVGWDK